MCEFFSCIATKDGRLLFTEEDSHEEIVMRAGLRDTEPFLRSFVRLECTPPFESVTVDEDGSLPGWFELDAWSHKVLMRAQRVKKMVDVYDALEKPAYVVYQDISRPAYQDQWAVSNAAYADYSAIWTTAKKNMEAAVCTNGIYGAFPAAREEYGAIRDAALANYEAIKEPAYADYMVIRDAAYADYEVIQAPAFADLLRNLAQIPGYVPA